ncbi:uncharacterized protein, partial [Procambarus clarkii]|uniref:uncharacterized protein n=1 Tax=Procambarus clarkii TaxID=6728 RepID=UPI003743B372
MVERDENGRLKLPSDRYIPFQRVLTRSTRSSRRPSPVGHNSQWGEGGSSRISRNHSRNHSHNASDDEHHYHHRFANPDDVASTLGNLHLDRRKKERRSHSLSNDSNSSHTPKMPFIPFQRVLNRRRTPLPPAFTDFRHDQPKSNEHRDKHSRHHKAETYHHKPFASEYSSKHKTKHGKVKRKPGRHKNKPQINNMIHDNTEMRQHEKHHNDDDYDDDREDANYDHESDRKHHHKPEYRDDVDEAFEENNSAHSLRSHRGSKHSADSNDYDDRELDHEERTHSNSSVKFPQIRGSPLSSDSARSVHGYGAAPPKMPSLSSPSGSPSTPSQRPESQTTLDPLESSKWVEGKGAGRMHNFFQTLQPKKDMDNKDARSPRDTSSPVVQCRDTARWVEGKGAGRMQHFFQTLKPQKDVDDKDTTNPSDTSPSLLQCRDTAQWVNDKGAGRLREGFQLPKVDQTENSHSSSGPSSPVTPTDGGSESSNMYSKDNSYKDRKTTKQISTKKKNLTRSMSDSALYLPRAHVTNSNQQVKIVLKANQIVLFNEKAIRHKIDRGMRPHTSLPRIILTLPEEIGGSQPKLRKTRHSVIVKTRENAMSGMTRVPSLPNIYAKVNVQMKNSKPVLPPSSAISQQAPESQSLNQVDCVSQNSIPVSSTTNDKLNTERQESNHSKPRFKIATARHKRQSKKRSLSRRKSETTLLGRKHIAPYWRRHSMPTINTHARRFSKSSRASSRKRYESYQAQEVGESEDSPWGSRDFKLDNIKSHIIAIQQERGHRQQRFAHFLKSSVSKQEERTPAAETDEAAHGEAHHSYEAHHSSTEHPSIYTQPLSQSSTQSPVTQPTTIHETATIT